MHPLEDVFLPQQNGAFSSSSPSDIIPYLKINNPCKYGCGESEDRVSIDK
jgi:hypothetical protein